MARVDDSDVLAGNRVWIRFLEETGVRTPERSGVLLEHIYQGIADARERGRAEAATYEERPTPIETPFKRGPYDRLLSRLVAFLDWLTKPAEREETL